MVFTVLAFEFELLIFHTFICSHGEDFQPLHMYRNSLVHGEGDIPAVISKRPYTRKRKAGEDDDDGSDEEY